MKYVLLLAFVLVSCSSDKHKAIVTPDSVLFPNGKLIPAFNDCMLLTDDTSGFIGWIRNRYVGQSKLLLIGRMGRPKFVEEYDDMTFLCYEFSDKDTVKLVEFSILDSNGKIIFARSLGLSSNWEEDTTSSF